MSKKQQILETAIQLFAQQGIEATSIQHITKTTGISKGAFYLSFASKEDLIKEIIDTFMKQFVADIDRVVNTPLLADEKLQNYFSAHLNLLEKHADFAKMYAQEQMYSINEEVVEKLMYYDALIDQSLLSLFQELFPQQSEQQAIDLLVSIKGLIRIYSQLILFHPYPHDTTRIVEVLVEKTMLLGEHSKTFYLTMEMVKLPVTSESQLPTTRQIQMVIEELQKERHPELIEETFEVLREELQREQPRQAVLQGLYGHLIAYTPTKWLSYLVKQIDTKKDA